MYSPCPIINMLGTKVFIIVCKDYTKVYYSIEIASASVSKIKAIRGGDEMKKSINAMYFSATGTTKTIVCCIADTMLKSLGLRELGKNIDFTLPIAREAAVSFSQEDIVIVGVPVYAGRVPNVLLAFLNRLNGNGAWAIPVVVYGNRDYDDALIELRDILIARGFTAIAGAAFIGEHSFSKVLAENRPDGKDMDIARVFANQICRKI